MPSQGEAPLTVTLDASHSSDPDGTIAQYDWTVNGQPISLSTDTTNFSVDNASVETVGGATVTKKTVTIVFKTTGDYIIGLTVTDNNGLTDQTQRTVKVSSPNQPPKANFTASPTEGIAPLTVTLDFSGSVDPDGKIVQYDWSVNGQPISPTSATTDTKTMRFDTAGTYTIVLKVTDNDGLTAQTKKTIKVEECTYQINPTSRSHDSSADSDSVNVSAPTGCNWTANSNTSWATITSGSHGQSSDIVRYSVMDNLSTESRDGTLTIAGRTFALEQAGSIPPTNPHTLILTNREKLAQLYGPTDADRIISKLNDLASHADVQGLVIPVENDATVAAAIARRGNNYDDKNKANTVAEAIKQLILNQWHTHLEHVVIAGDDRVVPFYRLKDGTSTPDTWTLTDDFYTDRVPTNCSGCANPETYIADIASGRLIETPSQMIDVIDTFLADNTLNIDDAAVTGYDFIQDGAQAHCNTLQSAGIFADCALIGEHWTSRDFNRDILNTYHDVTSINGHANHKFFGTPSGYVYADDFSDTSTDFAGTLFYTVGCHSGQNVSDELDLPESLAILRANYIANTGYGWGYTGGIGLSEELMWNLTKELVKPETTLGKALINAKQQYFADNPAFDAYDEKIVTESTLYGLPMYQVNSSATPPAIGITTTQRGEIQENGLQKTSYAYTWARTTPAAVSGKTFYSLNGRTAGDEGEPILPKFTNEVSHTGKVLQGVVFRGGSYTTVDTAPPLQRFKTTTGHLSPERTFNAPGWYPSIFFTPHTVQLNAVRKETLVATAGQYNPNVSQQRLFDNMDFDIYHSANANDQTVPTVYLTDSRLSGNTAKVTVTTSDASGIKEVVVAYTDGEGTWNSANLTDSGETWTGQFAANANTEFFIQSVDNVGNVAINDQDGAYFKLDGFGQDAFTAQIQFQDLKAFYNIGETVTVNVAEKSGLGSRSQSVDFWVAIQLPTGDLLFKTTSPIFPFSPEPQLLKSSVPTQETTHAILEFRVPPGMGGEYTLYALYVAERKNPLADGLEAVSRSNLAMQTIRLAD